MKTSLFRILAAVTLLFFSVVNFAQAPNLGTAAGFVLFTSTGAVGNTGPSYLTGNVGTNSGSSTGFGNVNGVMHNNNGATAQCAADVLGAYNQLNGAIPAFFHSSLLGNGDTLIAGVYSIAGVTTLSGDLTLNAKGNENAVFIFQVGAAFSTTANSKIKLINGAKACNVFWKIEGMVTMATATSFKGTLVVHNAAINMSTNDTLEGRALSTTGAISVSGVMAYTPIGCGSPVLMGPAAPNLGLTAAYTIFSSNGPVTNSGVTYVTGDVGTNVGLTTGFNPLTITGMLHPIADGSTAACAADLLNVYSYLNVLAPDIELLYPAQFGNNLVLTPHTYLMNAATSFNGTVYLDAQNNPDAVFVIKINGALSTGTFSKVALRNGAKAQNVYWKVEGAVSINDYSCFIGTIICNNGAIALATGDSINGRAFTTTGAITTAAIVAGQASPRPIISSVGPSQICNGAGTVCLYAEQYVQGIGAITSYQWKRGTIDIPGATLSYYRATQSGNYSVIVTTANGYSAESSQLLGYFVVQIGDTTPPKAVSLPDIKGACTVSATAPVTTDNCAGIVTGTTSDATSYSTVGTHVITWTFNDGNGNSSTATQNVIVVNQLSNFQAPDVSMNADSGKCEKTNASVPNPLARYSCLVIASNSNHPSTVYPVGVTMVAYTVLGTNATVYTVTQRVIVLPVAKTIRVEADTAKCEATNVDIGNPFSSASCNSGYNISNNHPSTTYALGSTSVTWTLTNKASGEVSRAYQVVDVRPIVPMVRIIADIGSCSATNITLPSPVSCLDAVNDHPATTYPLGINEVTWTLRSGLNVVSVTKQYVYVVPAALPLIRANMDSNSCTATVNLNTFFNGSLCNAFDVSNDHPSSSFPAGLNTVIWTFKYASAVDFKTKKREATSQQPLFQLLIKVLSIKYHLVCLHSFVTRHFHEIHSRCFIL